jgi:hypothetical protein
MRRLRIVPFVALALLGIAACEKPADKGVKARAFCHDVIQEGCVRAFDCIPPANRTPAFVAQYNTSVEECQAKPDQCAQYPASCPGFDDEAGATCLDEFSTQSCAELLFIQDGNPVIGLPGSCGAVCPTNAASE